MQNNIVTQRTAARFAVRSSTRTWTCAGTWRRTRWTSRGAACTACRRAPTCAARSSCDTCARTTTPSSAATCCMYDKCSWVPLHSRLIIIFIYCSSSCRFHDQIIIREFNLLSFFQGADSTVERVKKSELDAILNLLDVESDRILQGYSGSDVLYGGMQEDENRASKEVPNNEPKVF